MNLIRIWVTVWELLHPDSRWHVGRHRSGNVTDNWGITLSDLLDQIEADYALDYPESGWGDTDDADEDEFDGEDTAALAPVLSLPIPVVMISDAGTATIPAMRPVALPPPTLRALPGPYEEVFDTASLRVPPWIARRAS